MRPIQLLNNISKKHPTAWSHINIFRNSKGNDLPDWPDWCFLPLAAWIAIASNGADVTLEHASIAARLAALGTWRYTQGIYRFDNELYNALITTEINSDLPTEVLLRLKEWCVYIETPEHPDFHGFFAHLEHDIKTGHPELRLLIDYEDCLKPIILHLGEWNVEMALEKSIQTSIANQRHHNFPATLTEATEYFAPLLIETDASIAKQCLSLLLYLCSEEPEIDPVGNELPKSPKPKKVKKGPNSSPKCDTLQFKRLASFLQKPWLAA